MELITLIVVAFLCLLSKKTRKFAYVLLVILLLAFPFTFIAVLVITLVIHFINKSNQRKLYEPPTLPRND
jgi:NhaP-type Na+/H+ or K+/H+ antiporter